MYIIEIKENNKWKFRSHHQNLTSAMCNFEAVNNKAIRIRFKDGKVIVSKKPTIN